VSFCNKGRGEFLQYGEGVCFCNRGGVSFCNTMGCVFVIGGRGVILQ
jgi:hypothetical protein